MPKKISQEALNRVFNRQYICMRCNARMKANDQSVKAKKVKCRKCGSKQLRPKRKLAKTKA